MNTVINLLEIISLAVLNSNKVVLVTDELSLHSVQVRTDYNSIQIQQRKFASLHTLQLNPFSVTRINSWISQWIGHLYLSPLKIRAFKLLLCSLSGMQEIAYKLLVSE